MSDIEEEEEVEEPVQKVRSKRVFFNHIDSYCGKNIAKVSSHYFHVLVITKLHYIELNNLKIN